MNLARADNTIYVRVTGKASINVIGGITKIAKLGRSYYNAVINRVDNAPLLRIDSEYFPTSLVLFSAYQGKIYGNLRFKDLPTTLTTLDIYSHSGIYIEGVFSDIKHPMMHLFLSHYGLGFYKGDLATLLKLGIVILELRTSTAHEVTYTTCTPTQPLRGIWVPKSSIWTQAMTDQFLIDMSKATWIASGGSLNISAVAKRSTISDAAYAALQAKGLNITIP